MSKLVWEKGCNAVISPFDESVDATKLDVLRDISYDGKIYDLLRIQQDSDDIRFTKSELQSLVSYLNSVIPTMKDF